MAAYSTLRLQWLHLMLFMVFSRLLDGLVLLQVSRVFQVPCQ